MIDIDTIISSPQIEELIRQQSILTQYFGIDPEKEKEKERKREEHKNIDIKIKYN